MEKASPQVVEATCCNLRSIATEGFSPMRNIPLPPFDKGEFEYPPAPLF